MTTKSLTVIIPTCNRVETLERCLQALASQAPYGSGFEVIVVDDGSTDGTAQSISALIGGGGMNLRCFRQGNRGPAAARNLGIKNASGDVVLFIGDDIIPAPDLLAAHDYWHRQNRDPGAALLGYATWDPQLEITPFMRWLENGGPQFNFSELQDGAEADPCRFFYTCNISLKRSFMVDNGLFDEEFPHAAYEDMELGRRLGALGLKLIFNKKAVALHHHYTSLEEACKRMIKVGEARVIFNRKLGLPTNLYSRPLIRRVLSKIKILLYYRLAAFFEKKNIAAGIFGYVMEYYFIMGMDRFRGGTK